MYLTGHLAVDPSDVTELVQTGPTKGFRRLARMMMSGLNDERAERETFAAVTILQRINMAMRALSVTNIVHLSKDDHVVYDDQDGVEDDFRLALREFARQTDDEQRREFDTLTLVLEHVGNLLDYLIRIEIRRLHPVGECPITFEINGVFREFATPHDELTPESEQQLSDIFEDQEGYDAVQSSAETEFSDFLDDLEESCRNHLHVDELFRTSRTRILSPTHSREPRYCDGLTDPMFVPYYHWDYRTAYVWDWSDRCRDSNRTVSNCELVNEEGEVLATCGAEGVMLSDEVANESTASPAAEESSADDETPTSDESAHDVTGEAAVTEELPEIETSAAEVATPSNWLTDLLGGGSDDGESRSWFSFGDSDGDSVADSGSSCGGGCGGCGGE